MSALTLRLDDGDHNLLRNLAISRRTSINQVLTDLIRAEYDRAYPDRRQKAAAMTAEERNARLCQALGVDQLPTLTPEQEADLDRRMAQAQADADHIYGRHGADAA